MINVSVNNRKDLCVDQMHVVLSEVDMHYQIAVLMLPLAAWWLG
jgi:hypothetical protein